MPKGMNFVLGILFLGGGLFLIGQAVTVSTTLGGGGRFGGMSIPSGLIVLPLLLGIGMLFFNHQGNLWKYVTGLGIIFILLAVLLSIRITVSRISLFDFVMMFGLSVAGVGMLLRYWFYER